jgi:hypothetical protein
MPALTCGDASSAVYLNGNRRAIDAHLVWSKAFVVYSSSEASNDSPSITLVGSAEISTQTSPLRKCGTNRFVVGRVSHRSASVKTSTRKQRLFPDVACFHKHVVLSRVRFAGEARDDVEGNGSDPGHSTPRGLVHFPCLSQSSCLEFCSARRGMSDFARFSLSRLLLTLWESLRNLSHTMWPPTQPEVESKV